MQTAAQPPGRKAKMACTFNVEQAIATMSDVENEPKQIGKMESIVNQSDEEDSVLEWR